METDAGTVTGRAGKCEGCCELCGPLLLAFESCQVRICRRPNSEDDAPVFIFILASTSNTTK